MKDKFYNLTYLEKLFFKLLKKFPEADQQTILKAFELAKSQHQGQLRKEGAPYIIHPLSMAVYLMRKLKITDVDFIVATLLHDTIEDCDLDAWKIRNEFNKKTASLVQALTRKRPDDETEEQKKINKPKMFKELLEQNKDVLLIKAVDQLDNLKRWPYIPKDSPAVIKFPRWIDEAEEYYLEISKRGHPKTYKEMKKVLPKVLKKMRKIHGI